MKKILVFMFAILLVGTLVIGVTYSNRDDALTARNAYLSNSSIEAFDESKIEYLSDKICTISVGSLETSCKVCYRYNGDPNVFEGCVQLQNSTSLTEDTDLIEDSVSIELFANQEVFGFDYIERAMKEGDR